MFRAKKKVSPLPSPNSDYNQGSFSNKKRQHNGSYYQGLIRSINRFKRSKHARVVIPLLYIATFIILVLTKLYSSDSISNPLDFLIPSSSFLSSKSLSEASSQLRNSYNNNDNNDNLNSHLHHNNIDASAHSSAVSHKNFPYRADAMVLPNAPFKHVKDSTDIRVTKQIYYNAINEYLKKSAEDSTGLDQIPELAFHWKDWIDMHELTPLITEKPNCFIAGVLGNNVRTEWNGCINSPTKEKDALQFHFNSPALTHESEFRLRLRGKIYNYMKGPVPSKLVFLAGDLAFVSNVNEKLEILKSGLVEKYIRSKLKTNPGVDILTLEIDPEDALKTIEHTLNRKLTDETIGTSEIFLTADLFELPTDKRKSKKAALAKSAGQKYFHDIMLKHSNDLLSTEQYDWRFFNSHIEDDFERKANFHQLSRAWLHFCSNLGVNTWLAQETLLGWSRNGMIAPWEKILHFEVPARDLITIADSFNNSLIITDPLDGSGSYYLDVSPFYLERARENSGDASPEPTDIRFIDIRNGLYIEIHGLALSKHELEVPSRYIRSFGDDYTIKQDLTDRSRVNAKNKGFVNSGIGNFYHLSQLSPLRRTLYEGKLASIPQNAYLLLQNLYEGVVTTDNINGYRYIPHLRLWVDQNKCNYVPDEDIIYFQKGGSNFIGACHDLNIWKEYNMTQTATLFKVLEIRKEQKDEIMLMTSLDEIPLFYDDIWTRNRQYELHSNYGIELSLDLQNMENGYYFDRLTRR